MNKTEREYLQSMIQMYRSRVNEDTEFGDFYYFNSGAKEVLKHFAEHFGVEVKRG